jgi:cytochrome c oxidase cbb3-type subunit II
MWRLRLDFSGNRGDVDSKSDAGLMTTPDTSSDTDGEIMCGTTRYSFTVVALLLVAAVPIPAGAQPPVENSTTALGTHGANVGRDLYLARCASCHQADGAGLPDTFPPLKGSGVVNKVDATKHIQVVLNGLQGARAGGVMYAAAMPPYAGTLSDAEIAAIINYERSSWGNHGAPVTALQVATERDRPK